MIGQKATIFFSSLTALYAALSLGVASAQAPAPAAAPPAPQPYGAAGAAVARDPEAQKSALGDRRMQMTEKVTAADFKQIDGGPLLLAAYAVVWTVFFVVLLYTFVRLRRVGDDVRRLEAQLQASKSDGP